MFRATALTLTLILLCASCSERIHLADGAHAPSPPHQTESSAEAFRFGDHRLQPRADFQITAKILGKTRYRWDRLASLVPWDFALGWGHLSNERWLRGASITQGGRFMYWHLGDSGLPLDLVEESSANVHVIPADPILRQTLAELREGAIVSFTGQLVDVTLENGARIATSLSRKDRGAGACEILYLTAVEALPVETADGPGLAAP